MSSTLGGHLIFQRDDRRLLGARAIDRVEKEDIKKVPSREGPQCLLSCPSPLMSIPFRTLKRLRRWASSASVRLVVKIGHQRLQLELMSR